MRINDGINRIVIQPHGESEALPDLVSMTLNGNELCNENGDKQTYEVHVSKQSVLPINEDSQEDFSIGPNENDEYRFLNECSRLRKEKMKSKWCKKSKDSQNNGVFVVERTLGVDKFWCIILIETPKHKFTINDVLSVEFDNPIKFLAWVSDILMYDLFPSTNKILFDFRSRLKRTLVLTSCFEVSSHWVPIKPLFLYLLLMVTLCLALKAFF